MHFKAVIKRILRPVFRSALFFLYSHPALREKVQSLIRGLGLYGRARSLYRRIFLIANRSKARGRYDLAVANDALSPRTVQILAALKAATDRHRRAAR